VRTMNTQKAVTTILENDKEDTIYLRNVPNQRLKLFKFMML